MKGIVRALGVSRSNLLEQRRNRQKAREAVPEREPAAAAEAEETAENGLLLARIRELVGERPSYGYLLAPDPADRSIWMSLLAA